MIKLKKPLVVGDPAAPARVPYELTMDEIKVLSEDYFKKGFAVELRPIDNTGFYFLFIKSKGYWLFNGIPNYGNPTYEAPTLKEAIDQVINYYLGTPPNDPTDN